MRKNIFVLSLILILCFGCTNQANNMRQSNNGLIGENEPITRAEACKMAAFNKYSLEEINNLDRVIQFSDTSIDKWYDKYINAAFTAGFISGTEGNLVQPEEYLSLRQAQFLIDKIKGNANLKLQYSEEDKDKPIPYSVWVAAFEKTMDTTKLRSADITAYGTGSQCKELGESFMLTNLGITYIDQINGANYADKCFTAIVRDNSLIAVKSMSANMPIYDNVEVISSGNKFIVVKLAGGSRRFALDNVSFRDGDFVNIAFNNDGSYSVTKV